MYSMRATQGTLCSIVVRASSSGSRGFECLRFLSAGVSVSFSCVQLAAAEGALVMHWELATSRRGWERQKGLLFLFSLASSDDRD